MKVSPSILTCDFAHLAEAMQFVERSGADMVHIDVMDGVFVPNLTFGPPVIKCMRPHTNLPFDVHLMMQHPHRLIDDFIAAGADIVNFHVESAAPIVETLERIRAAGKKAALTIKPNTPAQAVFPYLEMVDMVLVMTVEPGFGGQKFMTDMLPKIAELRAEIDRRGLMVDIEVDGGVNEQTAPLCAKAGVTVTVAGSAFFNMQDPRPLVKILQSL